MTATRFSRPVEIPDDLADRAVAPAGGTVQLPSRLAWSGQGSLDLDSPRDRAYLYQLVMTEGTEDDVRRWIDLKLLMQMWDDMWLSPHVRQRWDRWLGDRDLIG